MLLPLLLCVATSIATIVVVVLYLTSLPFVPSPFAGNSASLRRRYDALNAGVKQHQRIVEEGVARRKDFDSCLASFMDPLKELEGKFDGLQLSGESLPLKVEEKVETVRVSLADSSLHPIT